MDDGARDQLQWAVITAALGNVEPLSGSQVERVVPNALGDAVRGRASSAVGTTRSTSDKGPAGTWAGIS